MRTLLWKEWREKRLWAIALLISTVGLVAIGKGYTFSGDLSTFSRWIWLSFLIALFFGMGAYSRDLSSGTIDFAYAKPVSWKKTLLAKLIVGLGLILTSVVMAAIVYRLTCPAEYVHAATAGRLASGVAMGSAIMIGLFLLGFACSVAVSGYVGSLVALIVAIMLVAAYGYVVSSIPSLQTVAPLWWTLGIIAGLVIAAVLTIRFGLTLPATVRLKRYAVVTLLVALAIAPLDWMKATTAWERQLFTEVWSTASPTGTFVIWYETPEDANLKSRSNDLGYPDLMEYRITRVADGKQAKIVREGFNHPEFDFIWPTPNTFAFVDEKLIDANGNPPTPHDLQHFDVNRFYSGLQVRRVRMDAQGNLHEDSFWAEKRKGRHGVATPSPDQQMLLVVSTRDWTVGVTNPSRELRVWSLGSLRPITPRIAFTGRYFDWQSNTEVRYRDAKGKRHIVRITPSEAKQ